MIIRLLNEVENEIRQVNDIYNESVRLKFLTADTIPVSYEERLVWLKRNSPEQHPVYVAEEAHRILGWLSVRPYRESRAAFRRVKEISYYVAQSHQRQGIGGALISQAIRMAPELNIRTFVAIVLEKNQPSIQLLEKFGFRQWGLLPQLAEFGDERCGHCYYGLHLGL